MANPVFNCPHCGVKAQFTEEVSTRYIESGNYFDYNIFRCAACDRLVLKAITYWHSTPHNATMVGQFPNIYIAEISQFAESVPEDVLIDFHEAIKCFEVEAYRACAAMCRRSLQSAMLEHGADNKKDLMDQIDELNIPKDMKDWAHNIRIFGNWGAHPDKDGLKDVDEIIAKEVIEFIKSFFTYVYAMPKRVSDSRKFIDSKKQLEGGSEEEEE